MKHKNIFWILLGSLVLFSAGYVLMAWQQPEEAKISQLRIFTINRGKMDDFVQAWLEGVYPLRRKYGFEIEGAWVITETNEFVWILSYDGPEGFEARDAAYYASEDRKTLEPDPRPYIAKAEAWLVTSILP